MVAVSEVLRTSNVDPRLVSVGMTLVRRNFFTALDCHYVSQSQFLYPVNMYSYGEITLYHFFNTGTVTMCHHYMFLLHHIGMWWWWWW